jgi:uncharacterized protein involved in response to NO
MLFGFAVAVIIGFLYTAGRNWTGLPTPHGATLAGLAALWLAGRLAMWYGPQAEGALSVVATVIDVSFLPLAAGFLAQVLIKAGSRRNYFIPLMLMVLALANLAFHLAVRGALSVDPLQALWFALGLITLLETIIGGRVIPMFTANGLRGVKQLQHHRLNQAAIATTALALALWVFASGTLAALVAMLACLLQLVRCIGWNPWATRTQPLLWSLHLAHGWLPLGLLLLALSQFGLVPRSAAVHAFAIGATGGLIIAMITRTALGHLGRPLRASGPETAMYAGVQLAAWVRVLGLLLLPGATLLMAPTGVRADRAIVRPNKCRRGPAAGARR